MVQMAKDDNGQVGIGFRCNGHTYAIKWQEGELLYGTFNRAMFHLADTTPLDNDVVTDVLVTVQDIEDSFWGKLDDR